ncbi:COMM domain-containing protein 3 isoform X2 [Harmonia axyridis]|uniref:COMM domain-containing protein 3 isoform X2 n=1 Tax=Harmonia axyridis TaxID=115357 RepID=UPI001E2755C7|nr:COMM domain-containing protein 3 isoform X2 [Harmonia axyridis]
MNLRDYTKKSLLNINNSKIVDDDTYLKLLENCFSVLCGAEELHNNASLHGSKPDLIKELYSNLLIATAEFVRNGLSEEEVKRYLFEECNIIETRLNIYVNLYSNRKKGIEITLMNIGRQAPHIVDVDWKIDFVIKSSSLEQDEGPLFRIGFTMEKFDEEEMCKKNQHLNFICNSQEMQDLIYKLKDAVKHCERVAAEL